MTIVRLAVDLVLQAGASMRGAAASLALIASRLGLDVEMPSFGAVRSWLLRLGVWSKNSADPEMVIQEDVGNSCLARFSSRPAHQT